MIKRIYRMLGITSSLVFTVILLLYFMKKSDNENQMTMVINEICSNNFSTAPLIDRENVDWIELYNATDSTINLSNWSISDDKENMEKYILPDIEIESGKSMLLYATGEDVVTDSGIFLNFKLSKDVRIYLCDSERKIVDSVVIPELVQNTSFARKTDAGEEWVKVTPSPLRTNNNAQPLQVVDVEEPKFSLASGFYSGTEYLELSVADGGLDIYYSLDGSEPSQESLWYSEPIMIADRSFEENILSARSDISTEGCYCYVPDITVDKITVVRAVAIDQEGNKSDVVTNSYIMDIHEKGTYENLAIVSLSTDPEYLFNENTGVYILGNRYMSDSDTESPNYLLKGRLSEGKASIEIFGQDRELLLNQDVGIRIHGHTTRNLSQKSFSIYAREMYSGKDLFNTDVFGEDNQYHKLLLYTDRDETKLRHELHAELLKDRALGIQNFLRCNVFINGEYWGVYSIAQVYDEDYVQNEYGIPAEEVFVYEGLLPEDLDTIVRNDAGLSGEDVYSALLEKMDLQSYIDYCATMIYIDHWDWLHHNGYMWKSTTTSSDNPFQDGRWRWLIYDTELCEGNSAANTFREGNIDTWHEDPIVRFLMTNESFREQFVITFMDLANTVFEKEYVFGRINSLFGTYEQAIEAQGLRWGDDWADEVYEELDEIREFFANRFDYITTCLQEEFSLRGELETVQLEVSDTEKGTIQVNSVTPEFRDRKWMGYYFSDYPITLSAIEHENGTFIGWYDRSGNLISEEPTIKVYLKEDNYYRAKYKEDSVYDK